MFRGRRARCSAGVTLVAAGLPAGFHSTTSDTANHLAAGSGTTTRELMHRTGHGSMPCSVDLSARRYAPDRSIRGRAERAGPIRSGRSPGEQLLTPVDPEKGHVGCTPVQPGREPVADRRSGARSGGVAAERPGDLVRCCLHPALTCVIRCITIARVKGDLYDGSPVDRLSIDAVDVPNETHLRRSDRYSGAVDIEPEHAVEAVFDSRRLVARDPKSRTGEAIRVVGYSAGMDRVLVVVLVPDGHSPGGLWQVATAWLADSRMLASTAGRRAEMADKELLDRIAAAVEDAEESPDEELEWTRHRELAKSPTVVYSVRIPVDRIEELRQLAADRDVQPTALIRTWVLAQLDAARSPEDYAQRWERDVRATAEQLRKLLDERPGAPWAEVS